MNSRFYKIILIIGIVIAVLAVPIFGLTYEPAQILEINFLDVGQGDAILIQTPFGQNILIDGGPDSSVIGELNNNLPFWDKTLDLVILTHPHDDHSAGLIDVLRRYDVENFLYNGAESSDSGYKALTDLLEEKNIPTKIISNPQTINLGEDCALNILYPSESLAGQNFENLNNTSIVSMLDCEQVKILLTGDAEVELEKELIKNGVQLEADILKVGHHGSDTSTSEEFLNLIMPEWAVMQVGEDNKFGHPNLRTIKRLERSGAKIFRTDTDGDINFFVEDGNIEVKD